MRVNRMDQNIGDHRNEVVNNIETNQRQASPLCQRLNVPSKLKSLAGILLNLALQLTFMLISTSYGVLCNPIVWFLLKILCSALSEIFIYIVLGICSIIVSVITQIDEYYSKTPANMNSGRGNQKQPNTSNDGASYLYTGSTKYNTFYSDDDDVLTERY